MCKLEAWLKPKAMYGTSDAVRVHEILCAIGKFHCPFSAC